jgi:RNA polymerase sigma factor (sigma-70 family)
MGAIAASNPVRQIHVLPLRTLSDERLAELAGAGESDAFGTLYERYREALARYCRSIVRDAEDAGDALQNTMVSVLRALQGHGPSGPVRPWLYRIAHNESVSIIRRRHPHEELSPETPDRADTEIASLAKYRLDSLLSDLRSLPENQRGALVMRELGGLEYAEIADALHLSPVSARKHVFEARVALNDIAVGRETDCGEIMRRISDGDGRVLRARSVRGHLRGCPSCSAFERGMRTRSKTLGLIPTLPLVGTGAVVAAVLHGGGGASTSVLAAGGSVAGGSIAVGSVAAAGSLLGGGSFAVLKGFAVAGALAVAGAGVIVSTSVTNHARHSQRTAAAVTHRARRHRARIATRSAPAAPKLVKPLHLAVARAPATRPAVTPTVTKTAAPTQTVAPVSYTPPKAHQIFSKPSSQAPVASVPVSVTTPTTTSTPTAAPTTPTTAPTPATATASPSTSWIQSIIEGALNTAGVGVAAAEAQAAQQLTQAGDSAATANSTVQGLITSILSGVLG